MNLRQAIAAASSRLEFTAALSDDARRDAQLLLLHTLHIPRTILFADPERALTAVQQEAYDAAIARRAAGEPVQYITGQQEFYGLMLKVTPAVLIPRPETELLVEAALVWLRDRQPNHRPLRVVDIGTGSGAIAIAIAHLLPQAQVTALDLSPAALAVAEDNAAAHGLDTRIRFLHSDLLGAVADEEPFDAVLSNPPYIPDSDRDSLHPQVRDHEPSSALFAGREGLDIYTRLIPQAFNALRSGGLLAMEIGHGQRDSLAALLSGWNGVEFLGDLQGIPRVVLAHRSK